MSKTTAPSVEKAVTLTDAERQSVQDSSGAPGRLSRRHFEAVQQIKADAYAAGLAAGLARATPSGEGDTD